MMPAVPPMLASPDFLHSMLTDPRATPEQRAAAAGLLGAGKGGMGGGGGGGMPAASAGSADTGFDAVAEIGKGVSAAGGMPSSGRGQQPSDMGDGTGPMGLPREFMDMVRQELKGGGQDDLTQQDKGLALARMGFGMAATPSAHFGVQLGSGALMGLQGLEEMKKERALERMKAMSLYNSALGTQALVGQRTANTAATNQKVGLIADQVLSPEEMTPVVNNIVSTGDYSQISRFGAGPAAVRNKSLAIRMLSEINPDLANQALAYSQNLEAHKGYGKQMGENAAGPSSFNPGSGQTLRTAPVPGPIAPPAGPAVAAPAVAAPSAAAPAVTPPVTAPPPAAAPVAIPAKPKVNVFDIIPAAEPLPQPTSEPMKAELTKRAEDLGKLGDTIDGAANAAKNMNFIYDNMNHARDHFVTGKGSTVWNEANAYLLQAANGINSTLGDGTIDTKSLENKVGNYQDFKKNSVNLIGSATRAVSPRASTQEMMFLSQGVPNNEMVDTGYDLIVNQLQAVNDFALAQQKAKQLYLQSPKNPSRTMNGFDTWFNNSVDPAVFMLHRMSPDAAAAAVNSIKRSNPQMAQKLIGQLTTAKTLGLFAEQ